MPSLELDSIQIEYIEVGADHRLTDGWLHRKIMPYAIFAQVLDGSYQIEINGHTEVIAKGEIAFVPSNTPVTFIHRAGKSGMMSAHWLHLRATLHGSVDLIDRLSIPGRLRKEQARFLGDAIARMRSLTGVACGQELISQVRQKELGYGIVGELCERFALKKSGGAALAHASRFRPVFDYVRAHLREPISVQQMARTVSLSPSHFFPLFKKAMRLSPMAYVQKARLARARELLTDDNSTIGQVAEAVGFANQFHFSRVFRAHFGTPPRIYRSRFALSPPVARSATAIRRS